MWRYSLLILVVFWGAGNRVRSEDAVKKDLEQFQGSWQAVAMHSDGQSASKEQVEGTRLIVEGNKFTLRVKDSVVTGTFSIDPTKTPKTIDVVLSSDQGTRKTKLLGIYEIKGDKRRSCFTLADKERPTKLSPAEGCFGFEWKRN
jgi:uncharacterized protein (TIGR03067 family)